MSIYSPLPQGSSTSSPNIGLKHLAQNISIDAVTTWVAAAATWGGARAVSYISPCPVSHSNALALGAVNGAVDAGIEVFAPSYFDRLDKSAGLMNARTAIKAIFTAVTSWGILYKSGVPISFKNAALLSAGSALIQTLLKGDFKFSLNTSKMTSSTQRL